jgi:hypothetical protein
MHRPASHPDSAFLVLAALEPKHFLALEKECRRAGIRTEMTRSLATADDVAPRATALVWLVDDHPMSGVIATTDRLRTQRPGLRIVLVTTRPDELTALLARVSGRSAPVVLTTPASGTDIFRALRSPLHPTSPNNAARPAEAIRGASQAVVAQTTPTRSKSELTVARYSMMVRDLCTTVDELSKSVLFSRTEAECAIGDHETVAALGKLKLSLVSLADTVAHLRGLAQTFASVEPEKEPAFDVGVLVAERLASARPAFPPSCACKTRVQAGLWIHADQALLAEALSLLLEAASLRLHGTTDAQLCPRLSLSLKARKSLTILGLAYNASRRGSGKAQEHEQRALEILKSMGGAASTRSTKRWSILQIKLPSC